MDCHELSALVNHLSLSSDGARLANSVNPVNPRNVDPWNPMNTGSQLKLTRKQRLAWHLGTQGPEPLVLMGCAYSGKSYLLHKVVLELVRQGRGVVVVGSQMQRLSEHDRNRLRDGVKLLCVVTGPEPPGWVTQSPVPVHTLVFDRSDVQELTELISDLEASGSHSEAQ